MEPYRINCPETLFRDFGSHDQAWPDHSKPARYRINCHEISILDNVCENGQSWKGPISDNLHSLVPNTRNANGSKTTKFGTVDSIWADFQLPVPLDDDVFGIVPCLNYPSIEDASPNELLGVPMNDLCTDNYLASKEKKSNFQGNGYLTTVGKTEKMNKEQPVVVSASSACSVNDVERSRNNERKHYLKRKFRDIGNSEEKAHRARAGLKRSRAAEMRNHSERRRMNAKMRALQELIPNCNKVDEACMLDQAIEYLRRLKIEVQMLAMGTGSGLYIQGPYMPHFSPMGLGMFNMMKMIPFQGPHYPIPYLGPTLPGSSFQALWCLGQQPHMLWGSGVPSLNINSGLDV